MIWTYAAAATLLVAATTRIGRVLVSLTSTHGVHVGDLLVAAVMAGIASLVTVAILALT